MRPTSWVWLLLLLVLPAASSCASGPPVEEVAKQITTVSTSTAVAERPLLERNAVSRFYKARGFRPAFLGREEDVLAAIRGMAADGLDPADYHLAAIEARLEERKSKRTAESEAVLDVLLADAVAGMADDVRFGRVNPKRVNPAWNADPRDEAPALDTTLTAIAATRSVKDAINGQRPDHFVYRGLTSALAALRKLDAEGGWPSVRAGKDLKPGARDPRVAGVRRRLVASGELADGGRGDSTLYDPALVRAVEGFQSRHRIEGAKGVINRATVDAMNVSVKERIAQVRVNLERARWVLGGLGGDFMLVNLPAFKAYLIKGGQNVWESRTQIGEEAMQTPSFQAKIRTVVFNPDWTVPPSILADEILVDMRAGKNPIDRQGLVIYDASNNVVDPSSIDWGSATPENFPYTLRQPPGDDNALGDVKFLFPNKYSIYLHDTPNKRLFESDKRTFSHGCIRLENPMELAHLLLDPQGDAARIAEWSASEEQKHVAVENPIPIVIVYWTVSVGASGEVRFADDIYHLDAPLLGALDRARTRA